MIGLGWLHAPHAVSGIARGRVWQAEYMIRAVRDHHVLALGCLRHGLRLAGSRRAHRALPTLTELLLAEIAHTDAGLHERLTGRLRELAGQ